MAEFTDGQDVTYVADADLSGQQFKAVRISTDGKADVASGTAIAGIGILQNKPKSGESARVRIFGETKFLAGGTVVQNDELSTSGAGFLVATTVASGVTRFLYGRAKADVASGGIGTMTLTPTYRSSFT